MNQADEAKADQTVSRESELRKIVSTHPGKAAGYYQLAVFLKRNGRQAEALTVLDECIQISAAHPRMIKLRANLLLNIGQKSEASKWAMKGVIRHQGNLALRLTAARMLLENLAPEQAQEQIDAAMELDPGPRKLRSMKRLQKRINALSRHSSQRPLNWFTRRLNQRIANVAEEKKKK
jgi:predicted Zn-dependent protease